PVEFRCGVAEPASKHAGAPDEHAGVPDVIAGGEKLPGPIERGLLRESLHANDSRVDFAVQLQISVAGMRLSGLDADGHEVFALRGEVVGTIEHSLEFVLVRDV